MFVCVRVCVRACMRKRLCVCLFVQHACAYVSGAQIVLGRFIECSETFLSMSVESMVRICLKNLHLAKKQAQASFTQTLLQDGSLCRNDIDR